MLLGSMALRWSNRRPVCPRTSSTTPSGRIFSPLSTIQERFIYSAIRRLWICLLPSSQSPKFFTESELGNLNAVFAFLPNGHLFPNVCWCSMALRWSSRRPVCPRTSSTTSSSRILSSSTTLQERGLNPFLLLGIRGQSLRVCAVQTDIPVEAKGTCVEDLTWIRFFRRKQAENVFLFQEYFGLHYSPYILL